jgi:hypothetical protein
MGFLVKQCDDEADYCPEVGTQKTLVLCNAFVVKLTKHHQLVLILTA